MSTVAVNNITSLDPLLDPVAIQATGVNLNGVALESTANKNQNNGYAGLDGSGKVASNVLPGSVLIYKGVWDASTNSPALVDGTGSPGWLYRVTVAGTQNLGSGSITYSVGDYVIQNSVGIWEKADTGDTVHSVFGRTGIVTAVSTDYAGIYLPVGALVTARYTTVAGQSIPNVTETVVDFDTLSFDSNSAVTTGAAWKFTAPSTGKYRVSIFILWSQSFAYTPGQYVQMSLNKNGIFHSILDILEIPLTGPQYVPLRGTDLVDLLPGDYVNISAYQNTGSSLALDTSPGVVYVNIERVGA